jgi:hypothetical protein
MSTVRWQSFTVLMNLRQVMDKLFEECFISTFLELKPPFQSTASTARVKISRNWCNILAVAPQITLP